MFSKSLCFVAITTALAGCASAPPMKSFDQSSLPEAVKVPAGHRVAMETVGVGEITYECRDKKDAAGQFEWVFVGPSAVLKSRSGETVGTYFGPPATWRSNDGSAVTGTQLAVSPAPAGSGAMAGITYIQRVATKGGVAPAMTCDAASKGKREIVKYQSDYILYKAS
jgi:Protein of unknown function (DUF3455)